MKLYYSPGTCSLVSHILLREIGTEFELARVDLRSHRIEDGRPLAQVNDRDQVPVLERAPGDVLTEGAVIAQYIVESAGDTVLLPPAGEARYRVLEWQAFIGTELHKGFSPLFDAGLDDAARAHLRARLRGRFEWLEGRLAGREYLVDSGYSLADAYLFVVAGWARLVALDLSDLGNLQALLARVARRPAVQAALRAEGLTR
ncbi:MAG: glutathione transferase GstA [Pseudoxanthomonas sp.]|nr:glutathione transferase GstA [Pseudoxanthomonas sp.]